MKTTAVIFTYPPDFEIASLAASALRRLGVWVWLAIDSADGLPEIEGAGLIRTRFDRRGNLNGLDATLGILDCLALAAAQDGAERVLKVDSDTLVRSLDWLEAVEDVVGCGHDIPPGQQLFGACYAIRPTVLPALRDRVAINGTARSRAEDVLIGNAAEELGSYRRHILHVSPFFAPYHEGKSPEFHRAFSAICVQRTGKHATARKEVAAKMRALLAVF